MSHSYTWLRCWSYGGAISLWMGCAAVQPTVNTSATPPKATPTAPASSTPDSSAAGTRALAADAGAPPLVACVSSDITESRLTAAAPLRALDDWPIDGSDPVPGSDKSVPILRCGAMDSYSFVASIYRCADGSNPLRGNTRAGAGARRGNVGPNQRGHIIDLYEVPCPGGAERVFVDMYECPRDPQGLPSAKAMRVREPLPKESQDLLEAGLKLLDDEKYSEAIDVIQNALDIASRELDADHPQRATLLDLLGMLYLNVEKTRQAEKALASAYQLWKASDWPETPLTGNTCFRLASIYSERQQPALTACLAQQAIALLEPLKGTSDLRLLSAMMMLGQAYLQQGQLDAAERILRRAARLCGDSRGRRDQVFQAILSALADVYTQRGDQSKVDILRKRIQAIPTPRFQD